VRVEEGYEVAWAAALLHANTQQSCSKQPAIDEHSIVPFLFLPFLFLPFLFLPFLGGEGSFFGGVCLLRLWWCCL